MDRIYASAWLKGFFDGEGYVSVSNKMVGVGNTDNHLIDYATKCLYFLNIGFNKYSDRRKPPRKEFIRLHICRKVDILRFAKFIGFTTLEKQSRLKAIVAWHNRPRKGRCRWFDEPIPKEAITSLREKSYSVKQIAEHFNCHPVTIEKYMHKYGLPLQQHRNESIPTAEEIRELYWNQGLSSHQVSAILGYRGTGILKVMKHYNIPHRNPGRPPKIW